MSKIIDKYNDNSFRFEEDIQGYLDYAHVVRRDSINKTSQTMRSFCVVPDIIAVDILTKFGININNPELDQQDLNKFKSIVKKHYPKLLTGSITSGKY